MRWSVGALGCAALTRDVMWPFGASSGSSSLKSGNRDSAANGHHSLKPAACDRLRHGTHWQDRRARTSTLAKCGLLLCVQPSHLGKYVSHDLSRLVLGAVRELGPGQRVVEVVLHLVVLRQAEEVAVLHVQQVFGLTDRHTSH